jgi:integrase
MRVKLRGVNRSVVKLASGQLKTYWYAWRGGPRLEGEPGSPEFVRSYSAAHAARIRPRGGVVFTLIAEFKSSAEHQGLRPSTQRAYAAYLKLVEQEFGDMPIEALSDPAVRGEFKAWRDTMMSTPRKADYAWTTLARVLSVAKDRGRIPVNPCERGGRLYEADRKDKVWGEAELGKLFAVASKEMEIAIVLALWTGQRQGDLLRLPWSAYDGKRIRLRQSKTGRSVVIPVGTPLKEVLDRTDKRSTVMLTNSYGFPWTSDGFRTSWGKLRDRAGIRDLTFHDLRGSAVVRLALAGASVPEIATFTGHSLADVEAILDRHYLGRDVKLAESAVRKLERNEKRTKSTKRLQNASNRDDSNSTN